MSVTPIWHQRTADINLEMQPDQLIDKYSKGGFHIYKSSWDDLKKAMDPNYAKLYSSPKLYTRNQEKEKLDRVIDNWNSGVPLIPPMLIDIGNNTLVPADGKHRLKVASLAESDDIYFILFFRYFTTPLSN
ncbi:MAG: hypothetical protein K2P31_02610 [Rickettsiaceae bacterium]|nr:hypothetical protein [Rickettsiaceae bacterium]